MSDGRERFVVLTDEIQDLLLDIRYFSSFNFVGERICGYEEPVALMTAEAAKALRSASDAAVRLGYRLKVFDAYRPQRAVDHFLAWCRDVQDVRMRAYFYPYEDKSLFLKDGYVAARSGHSRGSTVDLTLFDMSLGRDADMGGPFDFFGLVSHRNCKDITEQQRRNRDVLYRLMTDSGFCGYDTEWWHFTLRDEPFSDVYFDFPVRR